MNLGTKHFGLAVRRAIAAIADRDDAYSKVVKELDDALRDLPHRHSGIEPTEEQDRRVSDAWDRREAEWTRVAAVFDQELAKVEDPTVGDVEAIVDRLLSKD